MLVGSVVLSLLRMTGIFLGTSCIIVVFLIVVYNYLQ